MPEISEFLALLPCVIIESVTHEPQGRLFSNAGLHRMRWEKPYANLWKIGVSRREPNLRSSWTGPR